MLRMCIGICSDIYDPIPKIFCVANHSVQPVSGIGMQAMARGFEESKISEFSYILAHQQSGTIDISFQHIKQEGSDSFYNNLFLTDTCIFI